MSVLESLSTNRLVEAAALNLGSSGFSFVKQNLYVPV